MKNKIALVALLIMLTFQFFSIFPRAEETTPSFNFELTSDGKSEIEVEQGDIITVVFKLQRTDSTSPYTMYAMQNEIRYDSTFFEIIEEGTVLHNSVISTDIAMVDQYREFYINFLSMKGGEEWNHSVIIGSIQLRVIADTGVSHITCEDYLISYPDGTGSYECSANNLAVIPSSSCTVSFVSNGGNEIGSQKILYGEKIKEPLTPSREGYIFAGWFKEIDLTTQWDFENDTVKSNMRLYAKWIQTNEISASNEINAESKMFWIFLIITLLLIIILFLSIKLTRKNKTNS